MAATRLPLSASPPRFTVRTDGGTSPARTSSAIAEGTVSISVTSWAAGCRGSARAFSATARVPPQARVQKISNTDMSKQIDVEPSTHDSSAAE